MNDIFAQAAALEGDPRNAARAIILYKTLLAVEPEHAAAHINLATIYYNQQNYELAEVHYRAALAIEPDYALALFDLGNVLDETGRVAEATQCYLKAIKISSTYADAHYNLALAYENMRQPLKALHHWKTYVKLDVAGPWSTHARTQITRILKKQPLHIAASNPKPRRTKRRAKLELCA